MTAELRRSRVANRFLGGASVRTKMTVIILGVCLVALVVASILILAYERQVFRRRSVDDLRTVAVLTAENLTAALAFDDPRDAVSVLESLRLKPAIHNAAIVRGDGSVLAALDPLKLEQARLTGGGLEYRFDRNRLEVYQEISLSGERLGYLYIDSDLSELSGLLRKSVTTVVAVALLSALVAVMMAAGLQRIVTAPIYNLGDVASRVAATGDFSLRAEEFYADEIGDLTSSFNNMLAEIGSRDKALRDSEARFRSIFAASPYAISLCRLSDGRWIDVNEQYTRLTGYLREDVLGQTGLDVNNWVDISVRDLFFKALRENGVVMDWEVKMRRADGEVYTALLSAVRTELEGEPVLIAMMSDVTEVKEAREELDRYRTRLEELVDERTRQLKEAQAELMQKERLAVLGRLTATVSHEIRNPLGTVRNAVFSIDDALGNDDRTRVDRALKLAERNIVRVDNIINELLFYTRRRVSDLMVTQVDHWLGALVDEFEVPEEVVLQRDLTCGASVRMDQEKLRRAVVNVLSNAVQAVLDPAAAGNLVTVSTAVTGGRMEIRVADTGSGMSAEVLEKVFEPLFSTKSFGVGLGMPIVRNVMEEHDGGIDISSEEGAGTTVTLWLPSGGGGEN